MTALAGLTDVGNVKASDVIVVSGAAGATGSSVVQVCPWAFLLRRLTARLADTPLLMRVQIAKNVIGCKKVIGIAGGTDKCKWVESLGADLCIDYRSPTFEAELAKATGDGVSVYWDKSVPCDHFVLRLSPDRLPLTYSTASVVRSSTPCSQSFRATARSSPAAPSRVSAISIPKTGRTPLTFAPPAPAAYNEPGVGQLSNFFEVIQMRITVKGFVPLLACVRDGPA